MIPFGPAVDLHISIIREFDILNFSVSLVKSSKFWDWFSILLAATVCLDLLLGHVTVSCCGTGLHYLFQFPEITVRICQNDNNTLMLFSNLCDVA